MLPEAAEMDAGRLPVARGWDDQGVRMTGETAAGRYRMGRGLLVLVLMTGVFAVNSASRARAAGPNAVVTDAGCRTSTLAGNDDGSTGEIPLGYTLNFFGTSHS